MCIVNTGAAELLKLLLLFQAVEKYLKEAQNVGRHLETLHIKLKGEKLDSQAEEQLMKTILESPEPLITKGTCYRPCIPLLHIISLETNID